MTQTAASTSQLTSLGNFIRERRTGLGLTQTELGNRLGWTQERISTLESGRYGMPSVPHLARLADGLEVSLADVLEATGYSAASSFRAHQVQPDHAQTLAMLYALERLLHIDALDFREALDEASNVVSEIMGADKVDVFLPDASGKILTAAGTSNTPMGRLQQELGLDRLPIEDGGRVAYTFETGQTFHTGHAENDPVERRDVVEKLGLRSLFNLPLTVQETRRGVLSINSTDSDRFTEDERIFAAAIAGWVALIMHRAELAQTAQG